MPPKPVNQRGWTNVVQGASLKTGLHQICKVNHTVFDVVFKNGGSNSFIGRPLEDW